MRLTKLADGFYVRADSVKLVRDSGHDGATKVLLDDGNEYLLFEEDAEAIAAEINNADE